MSATHTYQIARTLYNTLLITQRSADTAGLEIDCSEVLSFVSDLCMAAESAEDLYINPDRHSSNTWRALPDGSSQLVDSSGKVLAAVPPHWMDKVRLAVQKRGGRRAA